MSEILAPVGDKNSLVAAVNAGADAVYLGLKLYSARNSAENFDYESLSEATSYCHAFGVKVYVAMNTLVKDVEVDEFLQTALSAWNLGADALIVSDVFLGKFIKDNYPEIVLHLSTQAGICNVYGAKFAKKMGFSRVILARETNISDIKAIAEIIETEVFVQGALCTCFSGQCYMSSFGGGNSGNRGRCKQPCRKRYSIDREGFEDLSYKLSLSDLCIGQNIEELLGCGVVSFKIEGRMRRAEYVSAAVKYYRGILDDKPKRNDLSDLKRTYNRGNYTKGLAWGQDKSFLSSAVQGHIGEYVGTVKVENGKYICESNQNFVVGDYFKVLRDGKEVGGAKYLNKIGSNIVVSSTARLKNGDKLFVTTDTVLNARLLNEKRLISLTVSARFMVGKKAQVTVNGKIYFGTTELSASLNRPLSENDYENCFKKVDKYPFSVEFTQFETDGVFVPVSELNALRRSIYNDYWLNISQNHNKSYKPTYTLPQVCEQKNEKFAAICTTFNGIACDIAILKLESLDEDISALTENFNGEKYLYLPPYLTGLEIEKLIPLIKKFDGIFCEGIYGFELAEELHTRLFVGTGLNISNRVDLNYCKANYICLSKELTETEIKILKTEKTFYLSSGNIKVMDLIYCPFGKKCKTCDKRRKYVLTDENGRKFPLHRYSFGECRFEVFNCADLVNGECGTGILCDCTLLDGKTITTICKSSNDLRAVLKNYTKGHGTSPVV